MLAIDRSKTKPLTNRAKCVRSVTEVRDQSSILSLCAAHCPLSLIFVPKAFIDSSPSMGTPTQVMQVSKERRKLNFKSNPSAAVETLEDTVTAGSFASFSSEAALRDV